MALNFDIKDPKTQKMIAIFMVPIVLIALFYHFMIKPKIDEYKNKAAEVTTLTQKLNATKKSLNSPAELTAQKEALQEKYKELEQYLPEEENVARLLDQLAQVEFKAKVYLVGFNAAQTIEGDGKPYRQNKYNVTIQAGYHQFVDFMSEIMALPRILSFSDLKMTLNTDQSAGGKSENEGLADQPRNLTIDCVLTSYVFTKVQQAEPAQKKVTTGK